MDRLTILLGRAIVLILDDSGEYKSLKNDIINIMLEEDTEWKESQG